MVFGVNLARDTLSISSKTAKLTPHKAGLKFLLQLLSEFLFILFHRVFWIKSLDFMKQNQGRGRF